jgi:hypothetical protein
MSVQIETDISLEFEGHELSLRNEGDSLVAEFSSLSARRRLRQVVPLRPGPIPEVMRFPGLDEITGRVVVRGRTIAVLATRGYVAKVNPAWWGLLATLLHFPKPRA